MNAIGIIFGIVMVIYLFGMTVNNGKDLHNKRKNNKTYNK